MRQLFLSALLLPLALWSAVIETTQFADILNHVRPDTLVVCDIDNTLLMSSNHLGSVAWADSMIAGMLRKGISSHDAEHIMSIYWRAVQPTVKVELVDKSTAVVLAAIQNQNIPFICLTARAPHEEEYTKIQLGSLDIHPKLELARQEFPLKFKALYGDGILFATPLNKKSDAFLAFLTANQLTPEHIIFVDDKKRHVDDVILSLEKLGIPCVGVHFRGADASVKQFNPRIAELQWEKFPEVLSDEEALIFLGN